MPAQEDKFAKATTLGLDGNSAAEAGALTLRVIGKGIFATHPLPSAGDVVIGRAEGAQVRIDDASISRRHAVLHVGERLSIEDLGSANGTRVRDRRLDAHQPAPFALGEVVDLGSVMLLVQPGWAGGRPRRLWPHGYFEGRLEEECARAARSRGRFVVVRLHVEGEAVAGAIEEALAGAMRSFDILASYGPGEYEVLLVDAGAAEVDDLLAGAGARLAGVGMRLTTGIAWFPADGRTPEDLIAHACEALRGPADGEPRVSVEPVLAVDGAMKQLLRLVERIAAGSISVLLLGETGVGKEVMAETIHRLSPRTGRPFVRIHCAALAETLLESELFGHEKGAFTGAVAAKPGLLETAHLGTVFLDEVGELPPVLQVKLLRVLEDQHVQRVGSVSPRPIDVRFVSATNRDLELEMARGTFRQDLYFRLNGMSFLVPPLRERRAEIEPLALSFLERAARLAGRPRIPVLSNEALDLLRSYRWPGNIRELRNAMERSVLLCSGDVIEPEHLPLENVGWTAPSGMGRPSTPAPPSAGDADVLRGKLDALERQRILEALESCAGNQTQAARQLGMSRGTLLARLEAHGLPRPRKTRRR